MAINPTDSEISGVETDVNPQRSAEFRTQTTETELRSAQQFTRVFSDCFQPIATNSWALPALDKKLSALQAASSLDEAEEVMSSGYSGRDNDENMAQRIEETISNRLMDNHRSRNLATYYPPHRPGYAFEDDAIAIPNQQGDAEVRQLLHAVQERVGHPVTGQHPEHVAIRTARDIKDGAIISQSTGFKENPNGTTTRSVVIACVAPPAENQTEGRQAAMALLETRNKEGVVLNAKLVPGFQATRGFQFDRASVYTSPRQVNTGSEASSPNPSK